MSDERLKAHLRAAVLGLRDMRVDAVEDLLAELADDLSDDDAHRELNDAIIEGIRWARRAASTTVIRGGAVLQYIGPRGERITHEWGREADAQPQIKAALAAVHAGRTVAQGVGDD